MKVHKMNEATMKKPVTIRSFLTTVFVFCVVVYALVYASHVYFDHTYYSAEIDGREYDSVERWSEYPGQYPGQYPGLTVAISDAMADTVITKREFVDILDMIVTADSIRADARTKSIKLKLQNLSE